MRRIITRANSRVTATLLMLLVGLNVWADGIVVTSDNFDDYFEYDSDFDFTITSGITMSSNVGGFFLKESVAEGSTLDFKGDFIPPTDGRNTRVFINKCVTITSSDKSAVFKSGDTGLYWCFGVSEGGDRTVIRNLKFDNCWVFDHGASYVTFDSIDVKVHNARIGGAYGAVSISTLKNGGHTSDHSTIKNSTFEFSDNGSASCIVIGCGGSYATFDNNTIVAASVSNILFSSAFNSFGDMPEYVTYTNNTITHEGTFSSSCYGITVCGNGNLVANNTVKYAGQAFANTFGVNVPPSPDKNIYRNNTTTGGGSMITLPNSIVENNHVSGTLTINQEDSVIFNTARDLSIGGNGSIIRNNCFFGNVQFKANSTDNTFADNAVNGYVQYLSNTKNNTITGNAIISTVTYAVSFSGNSSSNNTTEYNLLKSGGKQGDEAVQRSGTNNTIENNTGGTVITNSTVTMAAGDNGGTFYYVPDNTAVTIYDNVKVTGSVGQRVNIILMENASLTVEGKLNAPGKCLGIYVLTADGFTTGRVNVKAIDYGELRNSGGLVIVDGDTIDAGYLKKEPATDYELGFRTEYTSIPCIYAGVPNYSNLEIMNTSAFDGTDVAAYVYADDVLVWQKDTTGISADDKVVWTVNDPTIRPITANTLFRSSNDTVVYRIVVKEGDVVKCQQEFRYPILYNGNLGKDYAFPSLDTTLRVYSFTGDVQVILSGVDANLRNADTVRTEVFTVDLAGGKSIHKSLLYVSYNWDKEMDGDYNDWITVYNGDTIAPIASYRDHSNLGNYGRYGYGLVVYDVTGSVADGDNTLFLKKERDDVAVYPSVMIAMVEDPLDKPKNVYIVEEADLLSNLNNRNVDAIYPSSFHSVAGKSAMLYVFAAGAQAGEGNLVINNTEYTDVWAGTSSSADMFTTSVNPGDISVKFVSTGSTILSLHQMLVVELNDETTVVKATGNDVAENDAWFSLDGRKLDGMPTLKGLYIHGNRKVVIR